MNNKKIKKKKRKTPSQTCERPLRNVNQTVGNCESRERVDEYKEEEEDCDGIFGVDRNLLVLCSCKHGADLNISND